MSEPHKVSAPDDGTEFNKLWARREAYQILDKLYWKAVFSGEDIGRTILWNAMYHMEVQDSWTEPDVHPRLPSFNCDWNNGEWWK